MAFVKTEEVRRINRALNKTAKLYREAKARRLARLNLHPGQDVVLWVVAQSAHGVTVSEIAAYLGVEPPTVTRSLNRMENQGLFERLPNPNDRRQVRILVTRKGSALIAEVEAIWSDMAEKTLGHRSAEERAFVTEVLEEANARLREELGEDVLSKD